jgi:uncharacterized protein
MIDAHLHVVRPNLPGAGPLSPLLEAGAEATADALQREMHAAGVTHALAMGSCGATIDDPLGINGTLAVARLIPGLHAIGVADPTLGGDADHMRRVEAVVASDRVRALKVYLGYLHFAPSDRGDGCPSSSTQEIRTLRWRNSASRTRCRSTTWRSITRRRVSCWRISATRG